MVTRKVGPKDWSETNETDYCHKSQAQTGTTKSYLVTRE